MKSILLHTVYKYASRIFFIRRDKSREIPLWLQTQYSPDLCYSYISSSKNQNSHQFAKYSQATIQQTTSSKSNFLSNNKYDFSFSDIFFCIEGMILKISGLCALFLQLLMQVDRIQERICINSFAKIDD